MENREKNGDKYRIKIDNIIKLVVDELKLSIVLFFNCMPIGRASDSVMGPA